MRVNVKFSMGSTPWDLIYSKLDLLLQHQRVANRHERKSVYKEVANRLPNMQVCQLYSKILKFKGLTIRTRRLKCDEEKPSCFRCTDTGRRCDYESLAAVNTLTIM